MRKLTKTEEKKVISLTDNLRILEPIKKELSFKLSKVKHEYDADMSEVNAIQSIDKICQVCVDNNNHKVFFGKVVGYEKNKSGISILKLESVKGYFDIDDSDIIGRMPREVSNLKDVVHYNGITGKLYEGKKELIAN